MERFAQVSNQNGTLTQARLERYLPTNYHIRPSLTDDESYIIEGEDVAGWTLDGYVIPRLASGLIFAEEIK